MATGRAPVSLPFPPIGNFPSLSKREQESLYLDFQALAEQGRGTRWATKVVAPSDATAASKAGADLVLNGISDSTKLNALIADLVASHAPGRIVILEGTVLVTTPISVSGLGTKMLMIQGMGAAGLGATSGATTFTTSSDVYLCDFGGPATSDGSAVIVEGIKFDSSAATHRAINARDITVAVRDCTFVGVCGAINQTNSTGTGAGSYFVDNHVACSGSDDVVGISVGSGIDEPAIISRNIIKATGGTGIQAGNDNSTVPSYIVSENTVTGAGVGIKINGNVIENCAVTGNIVKSCTTGIQVGGYRHTVSGNIIDTVTTGILTGTDSQYPAILANHVTNYSGIAFRLANSTGPTVIANKASLGGSSACTIEATVAGAFVGYNDFGTGTITDSGSGSTVITAAGLPTGGTADYVLKKVTGADFDIAWALDPAIAKVATLGDILVGLGGGAATAIHLARVAMGDSYSGQFLITDPSDPTGVRWGPTLTVGTTAPTSPKVGDIWLDTT